jgi:hypothetical protein
MLYIGDGVRLSTGMATSPDQSSSRDYAHAITLDEASNSTMATQRLKSQNGEHPTSLEPRKRPSKIPIYVREQNQLNHSSDPHGGY